MDGMKTTTRSTVAKGMNLPTKVHTSKKGETSYNRKEFKNRKNWE
jgi:hypothetical protein